MKLAIFSRTFHPHIGGLERIAELIARHATTRGHSVEVVTDVSGLSTEDDRDFPFVITRTTSFIERLRAFTRADVILFMNVSLVGLFPAILSMKNVVFSHQSNYGGQGRVGKFLEWVKRQATRFFTNISLSNYTAGLIPGRSTIIPNAYDDSLFWPPSIQQRKFDFVFCGRLVSDKGVDLLLRAFAKVMSVVPDTHLTIIGDGAERRFLVSLASSLGLEGHVNFVGGLRGQDLVRELQRHRCMVVPSIWEEPFGIVALEGLACCDTVIVTRRGGLPEAIGPCGCVVEPAVENLAEAMLNVCEARQKGHALPGQPDLAGRIAHLRAHGVSAIGDRYLEVLERKA